MSLINEALKKAQAQRPPDATPDQPSPPGAPHRSPSSRGPTVWLVAALIAGIAIVFAGGAGLIVWGLMRGDEVPGSEVTVNASTPAPSEPAAQPEGAEAVSTALPPSELTPSEGLAESARDRPAAEEDASPATESAPGDSPTAVPESANNPGQADSSTAPAPGEVPTANPAVESFLDQIEVRGVMSGGRKALIYNRAAGRSNAYETGSTISNELQIKITDITEHTISFVDHDGYVYTKSF